QYTRAFLDFGTDLFQRTPEEGAELLAGLGDAVRVEVASILDTWGYVRFASRKPNPNHPLAVSRLLDPDPVRNRVRDALMKRDRTALMRLCAEIDPAEHPVQTVNLVAVFLAWLGPSREYAEEIALLRSAVWHHRKDFQSNHNLAFFLSRADGADE